MSQSSLLSGKFAHGISLAAPGRYHAWNNPQNPDDPIEAQALNPKTRQLLTGVDADCAEIQPLLEWRAWSANLLRCCSRGGWALLAISKVVVRRISEQHNDFIWVWMAVFCSAAVIDSDVSGFHRVPQKY